MYFLGSHQLITMLELYQCFCWLSLQVVELAQLKVYLWIPFVELHTLNKIVLDLFARQLEFDFQPGHQSVSIAQHSHLSVYLRKIIVILLIESLHRTARLSMQLQTHKTLGALISVPYTATNTLFAQQIVPSKRFIVSALYVIGLTYYVPESALILKVIISDRLPLSVDPAHPLYRLQTPLSELPSLLQLINDQEVLGEMKYYEWMIFVGYFEAVEVVLVVFVPLTDNSQSDDSIDASGIECEYPFECGFSHLVFAEMEVAVSHGYPGFDGQIVVHSEACFELIDTLLVEPSGEIDLGCQQMAVPCDGVLMRVHNFEQIFGQLQRLGESALIELEVSPQQYVLCIHAELPHRSIEYLLSPISEYLCIFGCERGLLGDEDCHQCVVHILLDASILSLSYVLRKYLIDYLLQDDVGVLGYFSKHIGRYFFELVISEGVRELKGQVTHCYFASQKSMAVDEAVVSIAYH